MTAAIVFAVAVVAQMVALFFAWCAGSDQARIEVNRVFPAISTGFAILALVCAAVGGAML